MKALCWLLLLCAGCSTAWERHDESLYETLQDPNSETFAAHADLLQEVIDNAREKDQRPPAGVCAEFAYYAARLGRKTEAKTFLQMERGYYPEATTFLVAFERYLDGVTPVPDPKAEGDAEEGAEDNGSDGTP